MPASLSLFAEASSAIIPDNGKKNNSDTISQEGIDVVPVQQNL
jgi:hypothetical protein